MMKSEAARRKLAADIESYICGEVPTPLALLQAATLENWEAAVRRRGDDFVLIMRGEVHKHSGFRPGETIQTSPVQWFDRRHRFVRTTNTLYTLGESAGREIPIDGIDI
ncbi:hypothetical protein [Tardiphaga sp. 813_E8_N1_3]|uniref:hypothetical protein n=1 Tax=Tardiphaga sp. 813_E8_N1_3 TaxID=3240760 RepID=UPI003F23ACE0